MGGKAALEARLVAAGRRPEEATAFRVSQLAWALGGVVVGMVVLAFDDALRTTEGRVERFMKKYGNKRSYK